MHLTNQDGSLSMLRRPAMGGSCHSWPMDAMGSRGLTSQLTQQGCSGERMRSGWLISWLAHGCTGSGWTASLLTDGCSGGRMRSGWTLSWFARARQETTRLFMRMLP